MPGGEALHPLDGTLRFRGEVVAWLVGTGGMEPAKDPVVRPVFQRCSGVQSELSFANSEPQHVDVGGEHGDQLRFRDVTALASLERGDEKSENEGYPLLAQKSEHGVVLEAIANLLAVKMARGAHP